MLPAYTIITTRSNSFLPDVKLNLWHNADVPKTVHWSFSLGRNYDSMLMTSNQQRNHDTLIEGNLINTDLETCKKMRKQRKKKEKNALSLRESSQHNDGVVMTVE